MIAFLRLFLAPLGAFQDNPSPDSGAGGLAEDAESLLDAWLRFFESLDWRRVIIMAAALVALVILLRTFAFFRHFGRRRRIRLNPKLAVYGGGPDDPGREELAAQRRVEANKIVATSSTTTVAGYDIIEQIEAVFVDGFRRPEEALEGLKAAGAMKGANAIVNVRQSRGSLGKCSASGDAVVVRKFIIAKSGPNSPPGRPSADGEASVHPTEAPSPPLDGPLHRGDQERKRGSGPTYV